MTTETTPLVAQRSGESPRPEPDGGTRLALFETMLLSRAYEEAILREYHADKGPGFDIGKGNIPGEMHLSAGQEPVAAGVCAHLTPDDAVTATHRPHHFAIAHGVDLKAMTAEIFGRANGLCHGRGGHMHLFDPAVHFSCSGIIAEGYPPALGQAFAFQREGKGRVAVAVTGEGAANQGAFHECLNLAARWSLPVVFVVEDNDWGISVARSSSTSVASNADRAAGYGIPGVRLDNDVEAVWAASREAVSLARAGDGPTLIEVHTLRMWGHFEGDAQGYRTDLDTVEQRDPIPAYSQKLRQLGVLDDTVESRVRTESHDLVEEAIAWAKAGPLPDPATATAYVFTEGANR